MKEEITQQIAVVNRKTYSIYLYGSDTIRLRLLPHAGKY